MKFPSPQALEKTEKSQFKQLMDEAAVKNYLSNHPDFLEKNPQLLSFMELSHSANGATSLVERQIKVLRERNQIMQGQLIDMLHSAHNNENLLIQCNHFMLSLLKTRNLQALCLKIITLLKQDFGLDQVAIVLVGNYPATESVKIFSDTCAIKSLLNCQFPDNQTLCGRLEAQPKKVLFGDDSEELSSFALIPLGENCDSGLLALASKDISRFEPEMGTLFVELIAKLVTHLTKRYETN